MGFFSFANSVTFFGKKATNTPTPAATTPVVETPVSASAWTVLQDSTGLEARDHLTVVLQINKDNGKRRRLHKVKGGEAIGLFSGGLYAGAGYGKGGVIGVRPDWDEAAACPKGTLAGFELNSSGDEAPKVKFDFPESFFNAVADAIAEVPGDETAQLVLRVCLSVGYKPQPGHEDALVAAGIAGYEIWDREVTDSDGGVTHRNQKDYVLTTKVFQFAVVTKDHPLWVTLRSRPVVRGGSGVASMGANKALDLDIAKLGSFGSRVVIHTQQPKPKQPIVGSLEPEAIDMADVLAAVQNDEESAWS